MALFDRAFASRTATKPIPILRVAALAAEIERLGVIVRRRHGTNPG